MGKQMFGSIKRIASLIELLGGHDTCELLVTRGVQAQAERRLSENGKDGLSSIT